MKTPAKKPAHATAKRSNEIVFWIGAKHHITLQLWNGERLRFSRRATAYFRAKAKEAGICVTRYAMNVIESGIMDCIREREKAA